MTSPQIFDTEEAELIDASHLPEGSVVASESVAWIRELPSTGSAWRSTRGSIVGDWKIDQAIQRGAQVLRVGYGKASK